MAPSRFDAEGIDRSCRRGRAGRRLLLGRHPVAEEDVDVLVLQRLIGDRNRENLDVRLVAEVLQNDGGCGGGGGDVGPADVGKTDGRAAIGICGECCCCDRESGNCGGGGQFECACRFHF